MLLKGATEIVSDPGPGFYSRLFLVEKATGGWRPVIDLSPLNRFIRLTPFKMETVASVLASIREDDFMASIDLRDAYFQIPIHRLSRKWLRFLSGGVVQGPVLRTICLTTGVHQGIRSDLRLGSCMGSGFSGIYTG